MPFPTPYYFFPESTFWYNARYFWPTSCQFRSLNEPTSPAAYSAIPQRSFQLVISPTFTERFPYPQPFAVSL